MSKYTLVCSYRDSNGGIKELDIKELYGVKLSSLIKIDQFTSKYSRIDIFKIIGDIYGIESSKFTSIFIKFKKWNSDNYGDLDVVVDDSKYNECIKKIKAPIVVNILDKIRTTEFVNRDDNLFKEELKKIMSMINDGSFENHPCNKNQLKDLVNMYKSCNETKEDEMIEKIRLRDLIALEFSRYKTFRGWYVESKKMRISYQRPNNIKKDNIRKSNEKVVVSNFGENMKKFDTGFEEKNNMTYSQYMTQKHNSGDIYPNPYREFEPAEEFFTEEEFEKSYLGVREVEDEFNNRDFRRRH